MQLERMKIRPDLQMKPSLHKMTENEIISLNYEPRY